MTEPINTPRRLSPAVLQPPPDRASINAATLGAICFVAATLCVGVTFWNADMAVQSGATLLGVALAASGLISLLAGD